MTKLWVSLVLAMLPRLPERARRFVEKVTAVHKDSWNDYDEYFWLHSKGTHRNLGSRKHASTEAGRTRPATWRITELKNLGPGDYVTTGSFGEPFHCVVWSRADGWQSRELSAKNEAFEKAREARMQEESIRKTTAMYAAVERVRSGHYLDVLLQLEKEGIVEEVSSKDPDYIPSDNYFIQFRIVPAADDAESEESVDDLAVGGGVR